MSLLNHFISDPNSEIRIRELKKDKVAQQFMFVDEFQDTDPVQTEMLFYLVRKWFFIMQNVIGIT